MEYPQRKLHRLKSWDYSQNGYYHITICTQNKRKVLSSVQQIGTDCVIKPSDIGKIVLSCWQKMEEVSPYIKLDYYCLMSNHLHGIIQIKNDIVGGQTPPLQQTTLGNIIAFFKYKTTKQVNSDTPLWQRNYYEHIIRNHQAYEEIAAYIIENPINWRNDKLYKEE